MIKTPKNLVTDSSSQPLSDQDLDVMMTALVNAHPKISHENSVAIKKALAKSRIPTNNARALEESIVRRRSNRAHFISRLANKKALPRPLNPTNNTRVLEESIVRNRNNRAHFMTSFATALSGSAAIGLITAVSLPELPIITGVAALLGFLATKKIAEKIDNPGVFDKY